MMDKELFKETVNPENAGTLPDPYICVEGPDDWYIGRYLPVLTGPVFGVCFTVSKDSGRPTAMPDNGVMPEAVYDFVKALSEVIKKEHPLDYCTLEYIVKEVVGFESGEDPADGTMNLMEYGMTPEDILAIEPRFEIVLPEDDDDDEF